MAGILAMRVLHRHAAGRLIGDAGGTCGRRYVGFMLTAWF